ncbi:MAG: prephenate dehydrogenase [Chitinophagaceae bacterium]
MIVTIIGTGLIGGSLALALKNKGIAQQIIGVDANSLHAAKALALGLVGKIENLETAIESSDLIVIAVPVNIVEQILPAVLDKVNKQVVMDVGSIKEGIIKSVAHHPKRTRFVATHPMWGTEYSGPEAAVNGAFSGRATVICDASASDSDAVETVENLYRQIGMHLVYMNAKEHDMHVAYISHVSHVISFALANTVLEKEKEEDKIFELASGGFESTVRLAKSHAAMWQPILMQNRENVLDVLNEYLAQLKKFKACLEKENDQYLGELIDNANKIKRIIK